MRVLVSTVAVVLACWNLTAATTEEQKAALLKTLEELGAAPLPTESPGLCEYLTRDDLDLQARLSVFDEFFAGHTFTDQHGFNLDAHLQYSSADKKQLARFAGAFAARSVKHTLTFAAGTSPVPLRALPFLEVLFNRGPAEISEAVASGIQDALAGDPLDLVPFFNVDAPYPRESVADAMQTCLTLGAFLGERDASAWLETPPDTAAFRKRTGVWLFDGGTLTPEHLISLESLFTAVSRTVHGVVAIHVPEMTGFGANDPLLRVPGLSMDLIAVDMGALRTLPENYPGEPPKTIPEFTALALERLASAIQIHQFALRPDLYQRTRFFFSLMTEKPDPVFTSLFPPEVAYGTMEERMAYLGYLWLINSQARLEAAINQAEQYHARAPLFALLLVADIHSGLADAAPLFKTSPNGLLLAEKTALRRQGPSAANMHVNGIAVGGRIWQYEMGDLAGTAPPR